MNSYDPSSHLKSQGTTFNGTSSTFIQPKLTINQPGDPYEQEADAMADKVLRMEDLFFQKKPLVVSSIQRKCAECEKEEEDQVQRKPGYGVVDSTLPGTAAIQRACAACEQEEKEQVQKKQIEPRGMASNGPVENYINNLSGSGVALSGEVRNYFEPRFGYDFSNVKVHTGSVAAKSAQSINALAYTAGNNIVFNDGQYSPGTVTGQRLLGHELTHTIQQGAVNSTYKGQHFTNTGNLQPSHVSRFSSTSQHLQRQEDLTATRFSGNKILEKTFDGPTLISKTNNRSGTHVRLIQQSLLALGYTLPIFGADGIFGDETETAVRQFQIDAGALKLDGIIGSETMRLLNIQDPGGTIGVAGPSPAPVTSAVFSEAATETFAGYDNSVAPNWLIVPVNERRQASVAIAPVGAIPTYVSDTPAVATVTRTNTGIVVTGVSHGTANITAQEGATVLGTLRVTVKNQIDRPVAFHFVCDSRPVAAGGPHCAAAAPTADTMRSLLNRVWHLQANIRFTDGGSHNIVVPGDMGPYVNDDGFGGDEMGIVTAAAPAPATYNVFRVWEVRLAHGAVNNGLNNGTNTLVGDAPCADGFGLPHEAGHALGLGHGSAFIMTPCGGRTDQRVSKAIADLVNP